jgi:4-amino-4-deoxy-L-arabinose transferase-like glycosyltransferase
MLPNTLFFIVGLIFLTGAIWFIQKNKVGYALVLIVTGGFLLRLFCASDPFLHPWDERYHALVAKNMIEAPFVPKLYETAPLALNYKHWGACEIWFHKQPLPLWCMALSLKVFGLHEWALRIPSLLLSTLAIYLTFRIGAFSFSASAGLWAALFQALNGLVIEAGAGRTATDHVDLFFLFFIEAAVFMAIVHQKNRKRRSLLLIGLFTGCAILCKWAPALIVLPVFISLNWNQKVVWKEVVLIAFVVVLVAMPWQIYAAVNFPLEYWWSRTHDLLHMTEALDGHNGAWYYHIHKARIIWNELIYVPLIWLLYQIAKLPRRPEATALAIWIIVPYIFFSLVATKMQGYLLFTAPAIFVCAAGFLDALKQFNTPFPFRHSFSLLSVTVWNGSNRFRISVHRNCLKKESSPCRMKSVVNPRVFW